VAQYNKPDPTGKKIDTVSEKAEPFFDETWLNMHYTKNISKQFKKKKKKKSWHFCDK
jgi:hypothetical protein